MWFGDSWECASDVVSTREFMQEQIDQLTSWIRDFIDIDCINWTELEEHAKELEAV
ncbi:MAG: hypothetical protein GY880_29920 [Planctomycetaceae bacterium]|nr:hypothetical protein [Planctomycetaceae bacterium]